MECLGRLDELQKVYEDPIAHFQEVCREKTEEQNTAKSINIPISLDKKMDENEDNYKNVGYGILKQLYLELGLNKFWSWKSQKHDTQYSVDQIFRLLVFGRALFPGSKKRTFEQKSIFFENFDGFSLDDVYDALDIISENKADLQKWLFEHSQSICTRDMSIAYFDCTNYYFDIGRPDLDELDDSGKPVDERGNEIAPKYRKHGPEKNHRPDPIVEMGLLMDKNGIPLGYDLFPGNESEKVHMRPIINQVREQFPQGRIIFVADRGLNTSDNIYWLNGDNKGDHNERDGYVYGQSVRTADREFKDWVLSGEYKKDIVQGKSGTKSFEFVHKSRIASKTLHVSVKNQSGDKSAKKTVTVDQKQLVYYSEKYAKKQKADRDSMIARTNDLIKHPQKYDKVTASGSAAYVRNLSFNKETGEVVTGRNLSLDVEKIKEQEQFDGYYSIVTSELNMSDKELQRIYSGLSKIEDSFRITKSEFNAQPVYVWTNEHIDAHFAVCFTALVLIRLLQALLDNKYPVGQILESLRKYSCVQIDSGLFQFTFFNEIMSECGKKLNIDVNNMYRTRQQIRRLLRY